jgi:hypothetical protein
MVAGEETGQGFERGVSGGLVLEENKEWGRVAG